MKAKAGEFPLHEQLKSYLTGREPSYEPLKLRVVSRSPYRVSQDGLHFFELESFGEQVAWEPQQAKLNLEEYTVVLSLEDWRFVLVKAGSPERLRLDIDVRKYKHITHFDFAPQMRLADACVSLFEASPFRELLEEEQRRAGLAAVGASPVDEQPGNRNRNSLRRNNSNSKLHGPKDSLDKEAARRKPDAADFAGPRNLTGLGVSGPQGKNNMQRLRETRSKYITNSQESFTEHLASRSHHKPDAPSLRALYDPKDEEQDLSPALGKRENGLQSSPQFRQPSEKSLTPLHVSNIKEQSFAGSGPEPLPEKRQALTHKSEVTFREASEQPALNYEELMECLAWDKSLLRWEDLVFAKEVVQHLKTAFAAAEKPHN